MKMHLVILLAFAITTASSCTLQKTIPISGQESGVLDNLHTVDNDALQAQERIGTAGGTFLLPAIIIKSSKPTQQGTVL